MAMLRPIDVIFKHPTQKFTVIYQNGKLWQLNRLEFDGKSLAYKRPYKGSREQIFVAHDQSLPEQDLLLRSQLATLPLPATVVGRNADEFEHWWRQNSFDYREHSSLAKAQQQQAKDQLANPSLPPVDTNVPVSPSLQPSIAPQVENTLINDSVKNSSLNTNTSNQPPQNTSSTTPNVTITPDNSDDIFADMMTELTKDLR